MVRGSTWNVASSAATSCPRARRPQRPPSPRRRFREGRCRCRDAFVVERMLFARPALAATALRRIMVSSTASSPRTSSTRHHRWSESSPDRSNSVCLNDIEPERACAHSFARMCALRRTASARDIGSHMSPRPRRAVASASNQIHRQRWLLIDAALVQ
jgi:hypothetical protein